MDKVIKMQKDALKSFCDNLNKRFVAARLTGDETVLSVLLPIEVKSGDIFCDIFFLPQDERMDGISFASLRAEIADVSKLEGEKLLELCVKLSVLNDTLPLGGYGTTPLNDGIHLDKLVFTATVPMTCIKDKGRMTELMETSLSTAAQIIKNTSDDLL